MSSLIIEFGKNRRQHVEDDAGGDRLRCRRVGSVVLLNLDVTLGHNLNLRRLAAAGGEIGAGQDLGLVEADQEVERGGQLQWVDDPVEKGEPEVGTELAGNEIDAGEFSGRGAGDLRPELLDRRDIELDHQRFDENMRHLLVGLAEHGDRLREGGGQLPT